MNSRAATEYQPAVPARFTDRERPGAIPVWGRERISWYDLLAFAAPLFRFVRFQFVGFLLGTDLILWFAFPFVVISKGRLLDAVLPRRFLFLGFLWLLGQVLTDILRVTPLEELARGWSMIGATLADFVILYVLLSENRRRIILYALAIALGTCAEYFLNPYGYSLSEPWKFGVGPAITGIIVLLATCCYARRFVCAGLLLFAGLLNVFMVSRAAGLVCDLAGHLCDRPNLCLRREPWTPRSKGSAPIPVSVLRQFWTAGRRPRRFARLDSRNYGFADHRARLLAHRFNLHALSCAPDGVPRLQKLPCRRGDKKIRWTHTGSFASVGRLGSGWRSRRHFLVLGIQSDNKRTPRAIHSRRASNPAHRIFHLSVGVGCPVLALWFRPPLPHDLLRNPSHVCTE